MHPQRWGDPAAATALPDSARGLVELAFGLGDRPAVADAPVPPSAVDPALVDDIVGSFLHAGQRPLLDAALREGRIAREGDPEWRDDVPVRVEAIPVRRGDRLIAVVARNTNLQGVRTPSRLELSYLQTATELSQMIANGTFPFAGQRSDHADTPRVGDGFIRVDEAGNVTSANREYWLFVGALSGALNSYSIASYSNMAGTMADRTVFAVGTNATVHVDGRIGNFSGTSSAAPVVTALGALIPGLRTEAREECRWTVCRRPPQGRSTCRPFNVPTACASHVQSSSAGSPTAR